MHFHLSCYIGLPLRSAERFTSLPGSVFITSLFPGLIYRRYGRAFSQESMRRFMSGARGYISLMSGRSISRSSRGWCSFSVGAYGSDWRDKKERLDDDVHRPILHCYSDNGIYTRAYCNTSRNFTKILETHFSRLSLFVDKNQTLASSHSFSSEQEPLCYIYIRSL